MCHCGTIQLIIIYVGSASKSIIYHRHNCGESRAFLLHSGAPLNGIIICRTALIDLLAPSPSLLQETPICLPGSSIQTKCHTTVNTTDSKWAADILQEQGRV